MRWFTQLFVVRKVLCENLAHIRGGRLESAEDVEYNYQLGM